VFQTTIGASSSVLAGSEARCVAVLAECCHNRKVSWSCAYDISTLQLNNTSTTSSGAELLKQYKSLRLNCVLVENIVESFVYGFPALTLAMLKLELKLI
jgi:hypothetical protein